MPIQDFKRALVTPPIQPDESFEAIFRRFYGQLALETLNVHNSIQEFSVPAPAGGTVTAVLPAPFSDNNYFAVGVPIGWNTTVYIAAAADVTATSVKFTFGTVSPGGAGVTLRVLAIR